MSYKNEIIQADISKEEILQSILNFLEDYFPDTLYIWHLLKYIQRGLISIENIHPEVYVNGLTEIKSVVIIYVTNNFPNIKLKTTPHKIILFHCDNQSIDLLESMINQCLRRNTSTKIFIEAFGTRFLSILEQIHRNIKNEKSGEIEHCFLMEIDRSTLEETKQKVQHVPNDIDIRPLSVTDANLINDSWEYKSESSLELIKFQIEHLPTLGAYRHGELVSWLLIKYNGSLGFAHTIIKERRQGLFSILNIKLAEEVFQMQDHVFCSALKRNLPSIELFTKLGYRTVCDGYWLHL